MLKLGNDLVADLVQQSSSDACQIRSRAMTFAGLAAASKRAAKLA
jgi:hypothetical protein